MSSNYDISHLFNIKDLVVVITGGGRGLGLVFANALDQNGAKAVYIVGRNEETLKEAAQNAKNGSLIPVAADIGNQASMKAVADRVKSEHGYINAVIANAGTESKGTPPALYMGIHPGSFMEAGMDEFTKCLHINTTGSFFTVCVFLDLLVEGNKKGNVSQKSQAIILTSAASFSRSFPGVAYATSKAASNYLCKALSTMFGPYDVRVNNLCPGYYPSDMSAGGAEFLAGPGVDATQEGTISKDFLPAGRFGTNEEIAGALLFLLSKSGAYMNGAVLLADGGVISQSVSCF